VIVDHLRKEKPKMLFEWSKRNEIIHKVIEDMEIRLNEFVDVTNEKIVIKADLRTLNAINGYYRLPWRSDFDEDRINLCFKRKDLKVICDFFGEMDLVGMSKPEKSEYILYLKIKEEHA